MSFIVGTDGPETLDGTPGDDDIFGLNEDDILNGLGGNDFLDGGAGDDVANGDAGNDTYMVDSLADVIGEDEGEGTDIVYAQATYVLSASAWVELLAAIDNSATTAIDLTGNDHTTALLGNNGDNVLTGGALGEILVGYDGQDTVNGGGGFDFLYGMTGNDVLNGGAGNDYLEGGAGSDTLAGGLDNDIYLVTDSLDVVVEATGEGTDTVYATTSYVLAASASVELLSTVENAATTTIDLTGGNQGGAILGNNGFNTLTGGTGMDVILGFAGNDTINGGDNTDNLFGMDGYDRLNGGNGNDFLDGGTGVDTMFGGNGFDVYVVDDSGDIARDNSAAGDIDSVVAMVDYQLEQQSGIDQLFAIDNTASTAMLLFGNEIANNIYGNAGANFLDGKAGTDQLTGYGGADIFNLSEVGAIDQNNLNPTSSSVDTIVDFTPGVDKIRLDTTRIQGILGMSGIFETGAAATNASTRLLYDPATGLLSYDRDGNGSVGPQTLAQLSTGLALQFSDFIIEANQAPNAHADNYGIAFTDSGSTIQIAMQQNDFDADGYRLWVTKIGVDGQPLVNVSTGLSPTSVTGTYGILSGGGKSGTFTYTLSATDPDTAALAVGQTVTEVFNYEVTDGFRGGVQLSLADFAMFAQSTITITITRAPDGSLTGKIDSHDAAKAPDHDAIAAPPVPQEAAPTQDSGPAAVSHAAFEQGASHQDLRLMIAAQLDQPEMLGHHPQLA
jgi:VCBS repeat-containing protein